MGVLTVTQPVTAAFLPPGKFHRQFPMMVSINRYINSQFNRPEIVYKPAFVYVNGMSLGLIRTSRGNNAQASPPQ